MLPYRFVIRNVDIWNPNGVQSAQDLLIEEHVVKSIEPTGTAAWSQGPVGPALLDGRGYALIPAGVDLQVHMRVPGQPEKELPLTGLRAALRGGVGCILTMPNTKPVIDSVAVCEQAKREMENAERATGVRVLYSAATTRGQEGREVVDAVALKKWGVSALTDDGIGVARDDVMLKAFEASAQTGLPVLQHAEVPGHGCALAAGPTQNKLGLKAYPAEAEWKMVERDLRLLRQVPKARYHVLHVSSAKTLELVRQAKAEGLQVTAEVTPHHLFFSSADIPEGNSSFKMNPPLRGPDDQKALLAALQDSTLDWVATDHAPHEDARKGTDFQAAAFGTTGLETALRVLLELKNRNLLSIQRLVQVFSSVPAKWIGVGEDFGEIKVGKRLRAAWVDAQAPAAPIKLAELESQSHNNCFLGAGLPGRVHGMINDAGFFSF